MLHVEHEHLGGVGRGGYERTGDVVLHEALLNGRVTTNGLYQLQQGILVEGVVHGCQHGERLSAAQEVGITHGRLLVHAVDLGLLQHIAEVAQLRGGLHLLPDSSALAGGIGCALVMIVPVRAGSEHYDNGQWTMDNG